MRVRTLHSRLVFIFSDESLVLLDNNGDDGTD